MPTRTTPRKRTNASRRPAKFSGARRKAAGRADGPASQEEGERLQKVLASAGVGSRRHCEELISEGRVEVDGEVVDRLGFKVDPRKAAIRVDGEQVKTRRAMQYFALHKPRGVLSTNLDPAGRMRAIDLVPDQQRLFTVGRLDKSSEGLILLTNDGEWANQLSHPRYGVAKIYEATVAGSVDFETLKTLRDGVHLAEGFAKVDGARIRARRKQSTILEVTLCEGKNREVRRILAKLGHKVQRLKRVAVGSLRLGDLEPGEFRHLRPEEVRKLTATPVQSGSRRRKGGAARRRPPA